MAGMLTAGSWAALTGQPAWVALALGGGGILAWLLVAALGAGERCLAAILDHRYRMAALQNRAKPVVHTTEARVALRSRWW
jgi:hypothetical protein